jgi:hypothetical protein
MEHNAQSRPPRERFEGLRLCGMILMAACTACAPRAARGALHLGGIAQALDQVSDSQPAFDSKSSTGTKIEGRAVQGGSAAEYQLNPDSLVPSGGIAGTSGTVKFSDWLHDHKETSASAGISLSEAIQYVPRPGKPVPDHPVPVTFYVYWRGQLNPNADFEAEYAQAISPPTVTAWCNFNLNVQQLNASQQVVGTETRQNTETGLPDGGVNEFEASIAIPFDVDPNDFIAYSLSIAATATRGGSFAFGALTFQNQGSSSAAMLQGGPMLEQPQVPPDNFFNIVLEHPPLEEGDRFVFDGGFYTSEVVTPEAGAINIVLIAAARGLVRRGKK